jgi:hypothetical protein
MVLFMFTLILLVYNKRNKLSKIYMFLVCGFFWGKTQQKSNVGDDKFNRHQTYYSVLIV